MAKAESERAIRALATTSYDTLAAEKREHPSFTSSESLSAYDYNIDRHPVGIRAKAIANQIRKAEDDMQACFKSPAQ
jgi:hypothetical protein